MQNHILLSWKNLLKKVISLFNVFALASMVEDDVDTDSNGSALKIIVYISTAAAQNIESLKVKVE